MLPDNILERRRAIGITQEQLAEAVGVSRQTISEWECGASTPDLVNAISLAKALDTTVDALANYKPEDNYGLPLPPKGKHVFGTVTVGAKGQIVIPKEARDLFSIKAGDSLLVLADEEQGLAMLKADDYLKSINAIREIIANQEGDL